MLAFRMSLQQLENFYYCCKELQADTIEKREAILLAMAELGQVDNVVQTKMSKEEYVKHLSQKFGNVLVIKKDN